MLVNLLCDANFILYKTVFNLHKEKILYGELYNALDAAYKEYSSQYKWNKVYIISDSRESSWRKRYLSDYKGTRTKDAEINWEFVYNTYNEFKQDKINEGKYQVIESDHIEADDWISYIVRETNKRGQSNVIISSDGDLKQLLRYEIYSSKYINCIFRDVFSYAKFFVPFNYKNFIRELQTYKPKNVFSGQYNNSFITFIETFQSIIEEVEPDAEIIKKIISGDTGDNIKSVIKKETKTGKTQGIGAAGAVKILESYKNDFDIHVDFTDDKWIHDITSYIFDNKNIIPSKEDVENLVSRIQENRRLIILDECYLPDDIKNTIYNYGIFS